MITIEAGETIGDIKARVDRMMQDRYPGCRVTWKKELFQQDIHLIGPDGNDTGEVMKMADHIAIKLKVDGGPSLVILFTEMTLCGAVGPSFPTEELVEREVLRHMCWYASEYIEGRFGAEQLHLGVE
jgi:hypothetical protein